MLRQSQLAGRVRLRGLLADNQTTAQQMAAERERFAALADPAAVRPVFSSFNLFPTPAPLALRVYGMAGISSAHSVLEPSAGTGNLLRNVPNVERCTAVEIDQELCDHLARTFPGIRLHCCDFLDWEAPQKFDRIIMNPPFKQGRDTKHIVQAQKHLLPGGRLVAICASGPRQHEQLKPLASEWHELPAGSFKGEGTNVSAAIVVIDA